MTIARAQMYRQLYQMGGIGSLPMDYGQSLQVPQQMPTNFSSAQNITMNPLLNYGQTPLTMASGGITRLGYQDGGMDQMMQPQMQEQSMMQPQQMMEPPLQGMEQSQQPNIKDPKQALELIIQMLIAQGIPPEQAREIAIQMVQAVAEGGMNEMSDERIGARFGGSMRQGYLFGGIGRAISGAVKGVTNAVKSVVKSDIGKLALTAAAIYASGGGFSPGGFSFLGNVEGGAGLLGSGGQFSLGNSYLGQNIFGTSVPGMDFVDGGAKQGFLGKLGITGGYGADLIPGGISSLLPGKGTLLSLGAGALGGALAGGVPQQNPGESNEDYQTRVNQYKLLYQQGVSNPLLSITNAPMNLYPNNPFYTQRRAEGGRIGYENGGIGDLIKQTTQQEFFGNNMLAAGGVPTRKNPAGITELDYRKKGGYVPPIGIKEKADDIPAMLSNNEFVFTAKAVRNAGRGNVNKGAQRMYGLMKQLEAGGMA